MTKLTVILPGKYVRVRIPKCNILASVGIKVALLIDGVLLFIRPGTSYPLRSRRVNWIKTKMGWV